jgi:hypothetical protein
MSQFNTEMTHQVSIENQETILTQPEEVVTNAITFETLKRSFFNHEFDTFRDSLTLPLRFYHSVYQRDESDDKKMEFILVNRNTGFVQSYEDMAKSSCVKFVCYRLDNQVFFESFWIVNDTRPLTELTDMDGFDVSESNALKAFDFFTKDFENTIDVSYLH